MAGFPHRRTDALGLRKTSLSRNQGGVAGPLTLHIGDEQLEQPIIERVSLGSPDHWKRFRELSHRRPFQFFSTIPALIMKSLTGRNEFTDEELALSKTGFYGPNSDKFDDLKKELYRADTHERFDLESFLEIMAKREDIEVRIPTFGDFFRGVRKSAGVVRRGYFESRENKSFPAHGKGLLARKRIIVAQTILVGKESNELHDDQAEESLSAEPENLEDERLARAGGFYAEALDDFDLAEIADITRLSVAQLEKYRDDPLVIPARTDLKRIVLAMKDIANARQHGRSVVTEASKKRKKQKEQQVLRDAINGLRIAWWYDSFEIINSKQFNIPQVPSELDYRDNNNPGKTRIVKRLLWRDINYSKLNATKEVLYELKSLIGNFMHQTLLGEDEFRQVNKALKDEIDLEHSIRQFLRDQRYMLHGVPYRIVRQFIFYECGGGPGLVWDRKREGEERKTARGT